VLGFIFQSYFADKFHARSTFVYRLWLIIAGGITILGVPFWFTSIEQGYFYTFTGLIAAQILFELGFTFVISQFSAHETGVLSITSGSDHHRSRLAHLLQFSDRWFRYMAFGYLLIVGTAGYFFFSAENSLPSSEWLYPWCILVFASALNLRYSARLAMVEGSGEVGQVAQLRLAHSVIGNILMWIALSLGWKLWAIPIASLIAFIATVIWLRRHHFILDLHSRLAFPITSKIDWRNEYLPMQWRIAFSWASGYLIFQAIIPIVFAKLGPVAAGQVGIALAMLNGIQSLGMSWVNSRVPEFGALIALHERRILNELFIDSFQKAITLVVIGVILLIAGVSLLHVYSLSLSSRIPDIATLTLFGVASIVNAAIFSMALYMRCHKEEPMLWSSVVGGLLVLLGVYIGASYSIELTAFIYVLITSIIGLPWAWILFKPYFQKDL
jgi:hypothetical protein